MPKNKAYLDTTILADALIKNGPDAQAAKNAVRSYQVSQLPVYAIKEFKSGALGYVSYLHGKLLESGSYPVTLLALAKIARQPNRVATCLRLLSDLRSKIINAPQNKALTATYGTLADAERTIYDSLVLESQMLVLKAWRRCDSFATEIVDDLQCYKRIPPKIKKSGRFDLSPTTCKTDDCCMTSALKARKMELTRLVSTIKRLPPKRENGPRQAVLHNLAVRGNFKMKDKDCRSLGDAVFALCCPIDADILTTNVSDHRPLANVLGKSVVSPEEILSP